MAKPRYIKGKDGKMLGSIGVGKTDVPTSAPAMPATSTEPNREPSAGYSSVYERFQAAHANTAPAFGDIPNGMTALLDDPDHGALTSSTYSGYWDFDEDAEDPTKPYDAWVETHLEYDEEDETVSHRHFATGEEARAWIVAETASRYQELQDFKTRLEALDGDVFSYSWNMLEEAEKQGLDLTGLEGYDAEEPGFTGNKIKYGDRAASIWTGYTGTSFVTVTENDETRHYVEFEDPTEAETFALRMTLFGK